MWVLGNQVCHAVSSIYTLGDPSFCNESKCFPMCKIEPGDPVVHIYDMHPVEVRVSLIVGAELELECRRSWRAEQMSTLRTLLACGR